LPVRPTIVDRHALLGNCGNRILPPGVALLVADFVGGLGALCPILRIIGDLEREWQFVGKALALLFAIGVNSIRHSHL
jgi:hypothetical protein